MSDAASKSTRHASPGWLIQRLSRRFEAEMEAELAPHGVALGQFALLMVVLEAEGLTQTELGAIYAMPAWKISRHLDGLVAAGLVIRQPDPVSRRTHRIVPTEAARAQATTLRAVGNRVNARLLSDLQPDQRDQLIALLQQVVLPGESF